MSHPRIAPLPLVALCLAVCSGQSVRSTRSGLLYFFDGYVFIGEEQIQQKFGRFQEIGEGNVLRTELGRAEVLLTPGVILRVDENSAVRMLSSSLTDTRVELLRGSAVIEVNREAAANPPDMLIYKDWHVHVQKDSVARIDSQPAQVRVLSGTADVSPFSTSGMVTVRRGEVLPFASVLVAEPATTPASDAFNTWAMNRSSMVSEDNSIAAGITDDPDQVDSSGVALGGFSYFPQTGIPSMGIAYPYGLSFWSPYQSWVNPYLSVYPYGLLYRSTPSGALLLPRPVGTGTIGRPIGPYLPRPSYPLPPRTPAISAPRVPAPHMTAPRVIHR